MNSIAILIQNNNNKFDLPTEKKDNNNEIIF